MQSGRRTAGRGCRGIRGVSGDFAGGIEHRFRGGFFCCRDLCESALCCTDFGRGAQRSTPGLQQGDGCKCKPAGQRFTEFQEEPIHGVVCQISIPSRQQSSRNRSCSSLLELCTCSASVMTRMSSISGICDRRSASSHARFCRP